MSSEVDVDEIDSFYERDKIQDYSELDSDFFDFKSVDTSPDFLNNVDYTLNSPLISDDLEHFLLYANNKTYNPLFKKTELWKQRASWLKESGINISMSSPVTKYHSNVAYLLMRTLNRTKKIQSLIEKTNKDAKQTHCLVKAFFKSWTKEKVNFQPRIGSSQACLGYGAYMLDLYIITLYLNASTKQELKNLCEEFKGSIWPSSREKKYPASDKKVGWGVEYETETLGTVYIGYGVVWIKSINSLWDRNMVLMFKDLATARFHTLFSMEHRQFFKYNTCNSTQIAKMYKLGDQVMSKYGCEAYNVYSMVEPLTSYHLSLIAGSHRPLIPPFPSFPLHLQNKTSELIASMPEAKEFFDHIIGMNEKNLLITAYGCFRHWGHPFIDYMKGLKALHKNVTSDEFPIDTEYAEELASDLAHKILYGHFHKHRRWYVDKELVPPNHPLYKNIMEGTWPDKNEQKRFPTGWHKLPLIQCWEIPETVDPALLYADKTHSINRDELIEFLQSNFSSSCPARKVLETFIYNPTTDWPAFLKQINDHGLDQIHLIIGLKLKERELKLIGRFFALMSWQLREYFVFTEYLIKKEVIPLFEGLTMADDQTTLLKKITNNTLGQGNSDYKTITIANHIDYNKWNNFQRKEATDPVFKVIGQFFGYPNLFTRTHEFFEKSIIYYKDRPDLMRVVNGEIVNKDPEQRVCWNGQAGGLEGLRQKGWSVLNLLVLERESRARNTDIKILAQGDNQVIFSKYTVDPYSDEEELKEHLDKIIKNNEAIMKTIRDATLSIGLKINEDETLQSADLSNYGKLFCYRGNPVCLEEKRYSRITCTTNDQLPSMANLLSTVSTNCLTVSHYSKSPKNSIVSYNWLGNFALNLINMHNPALRSSPYRLLKNPKCLDDPTFRSMVLYLDPSLGGVSGMSLTRFMIRMFPDPVCEGLTFWKMVYEGADDKKTRDLAVRCGNPKLRRFEIKHFSKLIEDPTSLNTYHGISAQQLLKEEIKRALEINAHKIKNEIVKDVVLFRKSEGESFNLFLENIKPCFPRFLSEFKSATYFGITDGVVGLFENSKTIRNLLKSKFKNTVDSVIVRNELMNLEGIYKHSISSISLIWRCSASKADELRFISWGRKILGMTIPHPAEMIKDYSLGGFNCQDCKQADPKGIFIAVILPKGMSNPDDSRGPYPPYFGSTTNKHTGLVSSYEKDTDIPFLRKASNLRDSFFWFIDPLNPLGKTISSNLQKLTGEDPGQLVEGFMRTGSPLHRFGCSRVSAGGYMANSSVYGSRMIISTDIFKRLGDTNYDFMYQSLMIYSQQLIGEVHNESPEPACYHLHISCKDCLRTIEEPQLTSSYIYDFPDKSGILTKWKPAGQEWFKRYTNAPIQPGDWTKYPNSKKCEEIGKVQALMFSVLRYTSSKEGGILEGLFPIAIRNRLEGTAYLNGIRKGLIKASCLAAITKPYFFGLSPVETVIKATYRELVHALCNYGNFVAFCEGTDISARIRSTPHKSAQSYPANTSDLGVPIRSILLQIPPNIRQEMTEEPDWIFADLSSIKLSAIVIAGHQVIKIVNSKDRDASKKAKCKELNDWYSYMLQGNVSEVCLQLLKSSDIRGCPSEVRHAVKNFIEILNVPLDDHLEKFENKASGDLMIIPVDFSSLEIGRELIDVPRYQNPLISGIRIPQISTGSFLKLESILENKKPFVNDILGAGDGSGGGSACLLRRFPQSRLIFNSLIEMDGVNLNGTLPSPPSAIDSMDNSVKSRCVNLKDAWQYSTDLSKQSTWSDFGKISRSYGLKINLIYMDMELRDDEMIDKIEDHLITYIGGFRQPLMTLIMKTYIYRIMTSDVLLKLGNIFKHVELIQTEWSSSQTSEVYVYCTGERSDTVLHRYPDYRALRTEIQKTYVFQSYTSEFKRALKMLKIDVCYGIPKRFLPDPYEQLFSIWYSIAPQSFPVVAMEQYFRRYHSNDAVKSIILSLICLTEQVISTTRWFKKPGIIPSTQSLKRLFSYYVGAWLTVALLNKDLLTARLTQILIDKPFLVNFDFIRSDHQVRKLDQSGVMQIINIEKYRLEWKLTNKPCNWSKKIYLGQDMARIGAVIRYLLAICKINRKSDLIDYHYNKLMSEHDKRYDYSLVKIRTDIFYPLTRY